MLLPKSSALALFLSSSSMSSLASKAFLSSSIFACISTILSGETFFLPWEIQREPWSHTYCKINQMKLSHAHMLVSIHTLLTALNGDGEDSLAEPLEGLKHDAVEQASLPTALLSNQNSSIRSRSVDEDEFSLKQTEL
ncbi:hypothetical protein EYF80_025912 [Liparis tanakae]|uniref:Uncharacterized protein n=1 Tax=Liparis tanakae TaxID=230148 RepID=A0A4Z2HFV3_9TELE|nr:hypothetical protein EYF80_025912 [Liparis tanakae]